MNLFQRFNEVGVTVLIATHDVEPDRALRHAPRDRSRAARMAGAVEPMPDLLSIVTERP